MDPIDPPDFERVSRIGDDGYLPRFRLDRMTSSLDSTILRASKKSRRISGLIDEFSKVSVYCQSLLGCLERSYGARGYPLALWCKPDLAQMVWEAEWLEWEDEMGN